MTKFEKGTLVISLIALIVSLVSLLKGPMANRFGKASAELILQRDSAFSWSFGHFQMNPYFQLINNGTPELRVDRFELRLTMESRDEIVLTGDSFIPPTTNNQTYAPMLKLADSTLESGKSFSGVVLLKEKRTSAEEDDFDDLDTLAVKSAAGKVTESIKRYQMIQERTLESRKKIDPNQLALIVPNAGTTFVGEPDLALQEKGRALFMKAAARFQKGEHVATLKEFDFGSNKIFEKSYRFSITDRDLKIFENSYVGLWNIGLNGNRTVANQHVKPVILKLKDK
jgi:hypothetical protein